MLTVLTVFAVLVIFTTADIVHTLRARAEGSGESVSECMGRLTTTMRDIILSAIIVKHLYLVSRCKSMGYTPLLTPPPPYLCVV
jgi:hypothetical protein